MFDPAQAGVYHCINRCVRRACLRGTDTATGRCFEHHKQWIPDRLQFLAGQSAIDVPGLAVMSNHLHVVLRNRPDRVARWSDEEVARRWWMLFPKRRNEDGTPAEPEPHELQSLTTDQARRDELRQRLSSLSWFLRCLAEPIARRANGEDEVTGRFWEGRYTQSGPAIVSHDNSGRVWRNLPRPQTESSTRIADCADVATSEKWVAPIVLFAGLIE